MIKIAFNKDELEWYADTEKWFNVTKSNIVKIDTMRWLEENTTNDVVICPSGAERPWRGDLNWENKLLGVRDAYDFWFENEDDALLFKLSFE